MRGAKPEGLRGRGNGIDFYFLKAVSRDMDPVPLLALAWEARATVPHSCAYRLEVQARIPLTHNSVQSHNCVHFLLYTCLTSLIKDSGSLHSALIIKTEICGRNRVLNKTYLINDQNVNISPIQMQNCIFDHTSSKFIQKSNSFVGVWPCQQSHMTISELCRSTVDAQFGMWL